MLKTSTCVKKTWLYLFIFAIFFGVYCFRESQRQNTSVGGRSVAGEKIISNERLTKVHFLDVGQGDAALIDFVDGKKMLIDCGANASVLEALGRVLKFDDRRIDYLLITHPDLDHYGGCIDVLDRFEVDTFVFNGMQKKTDKYFQEFWRAVENEDVQIKIMNHDEVWSIASTSLHFLFPDKPLLADLNDTNSGSIVLKLSVGESDVLLMGDAGLEVEKYLLEKNVDILDSELLKVGHHGSTSASGEDFLQAVTPQYAVFSVGEGNRYGHPSERVLKKIERIDAEVLRTDLEGDLEFTVSGSVIEKK